MNPFVLLRIGAAVAFAGHTLGAPWAPGSDSAVSLVVGAMKAAPVTEMGPDRSYWDLYFGFGVSVSIYLSALAVLLWQTANLPRSNFANARPFMASLFVCYLAVAVVGFRYFFFLPAVMAGVVCLRIGLAWRIGSRRSNVALAPPSGGQPTASFAVCGLPLMSNARCHATIGRSEFVIVARPHFLQRSVP